MTEQPRYYDAREDPAPRDPADVVVQIDPAAIVIPYRTPLEVAASTSDSPDWLVPGFLALGAISELDGKVKSSGKTTLLLDLIRAVLDGDAWLGRRTMTTKVVYLTEQTPGPFREALARANLLARGDELRLVFRGDVPGMAWHELIAQVTRDARREGYGLMVIDTLGKLAQVREENDAGEGGRVMAPLQDAAHAGIAVFVCRHERKGGGEVGESGRGSSAISGDVDVILQLRRAEGNVPRTRRVIETLSRYTETPDKVVIDLTEEGYVLLGDEEAVTLNEAIRKVSAHIETINEQKETATLEELVAELGLTRAAAQRAVRELIHRGEVVRRGEGRRGSPYTYSLVEGKVSAQTHGLIGAERNGGPQ